jgi:hypothetical protein
VVAVAGLVLGNLHLVQAVRPMLVCMQVKMAKITLATAAAVEVAVEAGPGATGAQLELVIPAL